MAKYVGHPIAPIMCTACGINMNRLVMPSLHPLLAVPVCVGCLAMCQGAFDLSPDDGKEVYCRWCGDGGEVLSCSTCVKSWCVGCINRQFDETELERIKSLPEWSCFVCVPATLAPVLARFSRWKAVHPYFKLLEDAWNSTPKTTPSKASSSQIPHAGLRDASTCHSQSSLEDFDGGSSPGGIQRRNSILRKEFSIHPQASEAEVALLSIFSYFLQLLKR